MGYTVKYSELYKQLIGVIVIPVVLVAIYILLLMLLNSLHPSEMDMNIFIYGGSVFLTISAIFFLRKYILMKADMEYDNYGIHFHLYSNSFLYSEDTFSILYDNIQSISLKKEEDYSVYIKIKTVTPKKIILISPIRNSDYDTLISCWNGINIKMEQT